MTPLAVLFMVTAVGGVTVLCGWCYYQVLSGTQHKQEDDPGRNDKTAG